jgi:DNA polymerase V
MHWAQAVPASFFPTRDPEHSARLMGALDAVNLRFGRDTLRPGGSRPSPRWGMRRARLSPCYTTRIEDMLSAES